MAWRRRVIKQRRKRGRKRKEKVIYEKRSKDIEMKDGRKEGRGRWMEEESKE